MNAETSEQRGLEQLLDESVHKQLRAAASARLRSGSYSWRTSDLVQEALVRVIQGQREQWSSKGHFYGYLAHSVHSAYVDYLRERNSLSRGEGARGVDIEHLVNLTDDRGTSVHALDVLALEEILIEVPPDRAKIVLLRTYFTWTQKQIADVLGIPLSRVRTVCAWFESKVRGALTNQPPSTE